MPSAFVFVPLETFVSRFVAVTSAPGITALLGSVVRPEIVALSFCAKDKLQSRAKLQSAAWADRNMSAPLHAGLPVLRSKGARFPTATESFSKLRGGSDHSRARRRGAFGRWAASCRPVVRW